MLNRCKLNGYFGRGSCSGELNTEMRMGEIKMTIPKAWVEH